jgi:ribosomal-protein-alanine N-acetyltransferase
MLEITTPRLQLIASTVGLARADCDDLQQFSHLLNAIVPTNWPPEFNDENSKRYTLNKLLENPVERGWHCWYFVLNSPLARTLIGIGGFKGKPDADGMVEVGYGVLPQFQRQGYGSEAVRGLLQWAFDQKVSVVNAETLPELTASSGLLKKLGFSFVGPTGEENVIRFAIQNPQLVLMQPNSYKL